MMGKLIYNCQTNFMPDRQIFDGFILINELLYFAKRKGKQCMMLKVDFKKSLRM